MSKIVKATSLSKTQLKMLDIGAPVIVSCKTVDGADVQVRLQSQNLDEGSNIELGTARDGADNLPGSWETHGVYVAIMPNGPDYGN